jgi:murein DD-endopeptidase MepM/ murein hydrolase activator NlpD
MLIPHSNVKTLNFKIPSIGIIISVILWIFGTVYIFSIAVDTVKYHIMEKKVNYYSQQFLELHTAITAIKNAENELKRLFHFGTKEKILENVETPNQGSIDMENFREEIKKTIETVDEIRDYLRHQRNLYFATPKFFPVEGNITSHFGMREHPINGGEEFHKGIDISAPYGTPIRAVADGIVSFSGGSGIKGNLVAIEHGCGFTTFYAHNRVNIVRVGEKLRRGEIIAYVGSTGNATGPHVHYEVWKDGKPVNPQKYAERGP